MELKLFHGYIVTRIVTSKLKSQHAYFTRHETLLLEIVTAEPNEKKKSLFLIQHLSTQY